MEDLMRTRPVLALFAILLLFGSLASAQQVLVGNKQALVLEPVNKLISDDDVVPLGTAGPGQSVFVVVSPDVNAPGSGRFGQGGTWNILEVANLPSGWSASPSLEFERPLKAKIKIPPNAKDGPYSVRLILTDRQDYQKIGGNVSFTALINVSRAVMDMDVGPSVVTTGASVPAGYFVTVRNKGISSDVFVISSSGVPLWDHTREVFVARGTEKTVRYEVVSGEEKTLDVTISAVSTSSDLISQSRTVRLITRTSLWSDYLAAGRGLLIFPGVEGPVYSFLGFVSNLISG